MEFRLLGSVGVVSGGGEEPLGGPKQRALLALLLLDANRVVSRDRLIDGLWGETPPPTAAHTLDTLVFRLRKVVGPERLRREGQGYVLTVQRDELDLERFERRAEEGASALGDGDARAGHDLLVAALGEWSGEPLAGVAAEPFAAGAVRRLEEKRLVVVEQRVDAALALGRSSELVPELERLVAVEPFRERLVGQFALALHRGGRSADALSQLAAARRRFADELGLELSPELKQLERRILQHDPALRVHVARAERRRIRRVPLAAAASVLLLAGVAAIVFHHRGGHAATSQAGTALLAQVGGDASVSLAGAGATTGADGSLWVAEPSQSLVLRVDPTRRSIVDRVQLSGTPGALAAGRDALWVATTQPGAVERIDYQTDTVTQSMRLGVNPVAIAVAGDELWLADSSDESLIELNPATREALTTVTLASHPSSFVIRGGTAWVVSHDDGTLTQVDLRTGAPVATTNVGVGASGVTLAGGGVWISNDLAGTATRIDPATLAETATISTGSGAVAIAAADASVWVANRYSQTLTRLDDTTGRIEKRIATAGGPVALAESGGRVWAAMEPVVAHRGGKLVLLAQGPFTSADPAIEYEVPPLQYHALAYDALVTFDHTGGPAGLQIVPDLAMAVPAPSDGGRTYALRLRPGILYSNGLTVHADDFRRSFERLFRAQSPVAPAFSAIVGADRCKATVCDLTRGVSVNDTQRTVVFHLVRPDPEFLFKLAYIFTAPVPPGTPMTEMRTSPFPGTGPYRIAESTPRTLRLVRNPYFREWSRAAQPAGNPDEIDWRFGLSPAQEASAIRAGRADWMFDNVPAGELAGLRRDHSGQLHASVAPETDFVQVDERVKPFDNPSVRRALNLAIDRTRVVAYYGNAARPACRFLPPGVPGFRPDCPYRFDLARAKSLVRAAHATGDRVVLIGFTDDSTIHRPLDRYLASVLRQMGLEPKIEWTSHAAFTDSQRAGLIPVGWYADYPAASDFFGVFLACRGAFNDGKVCDARLDRIIRAASAAEAVDPRRAAALWAAADRRAVDAGAVAPLANPTLFDFTSARVRGYEHHLLWGFLADQVQLR